MLQYTHSYGDAETRMTKHFPLDSIRQINLSRDHHDPKQFLFSCKLARAFIPPLLAHKKKGTLTVSFHLVGETFRTTSPTARYVHGSADAARS